MSEPLPPQLVAILERLGLATAGQVARMGRRVRRLARDVPGFESVWVDTLAQSRLLTPFQAAEINAGRGDRLKLGRFVLCERLPWPEYAVTYRARRIDSHEPVRIVLVENGFAPLEALAAASQRLPTEHLAPITDVGTDGERIWAAARWIEGQSAARWMVHNGRFPPEVVLEIARAMLAGLVALEKAGLSHGDICAAGLLLSDAGGVVLLQPGLRGILRPEEGYAHADLLPEAYDYLAPERVTAGTPPDRASDIYACGCLWWHLLCGRAALSGGNSLAKLQAAQAAGVPDVRRLAPETPGVLAAAVSACVEREPGRRPESIARLAAMLGPPTRSGKLALIQCLAQCGRPAARWAFSLQGIRAPSATPRRLVAAAVCLLLAVAILWPIWRGRQSLPTANIPGAAAAPPLPLGEGRGEGDRRDGLSATPLTLTLSQREREQKAPLSQGEREGDAGPQARPQDLVLAAGGPLELRSLEMLAGQCVRGAPGKRPLIMVPRTGLSVVVDNVRFENIDFVWDRAAEARAPGPRPADAAGAEQAAVIRLRAGRAEFHGCSFQAAGAAGAPPVAIDWVHPARPDDSELALPSGRVRLVNCVLRRVEAAVSCRTIGALALELSNTLHLGSGPLVRLDHWPGADEPVRIDLGRLTLRGTGPVLECRSVDPPAQSDGQPGEIVIQTAGCALVPAPGAALLLWSGRTSPQPLLRNVRWTGVGSLVTPDAPIAAWRPPSGPQQALDDASLSIAGLVRSEVEFAGDARSGPAASRITRWQAPLQSSDPPGVDASLLPSERSGAIR